MAFWKEEGTKGRKMFVETSPRRERDLAMGMEVMLRDGLFGGQGWRDLSVGQWPCLCKTRAKEEGKGFVKWWGGKGHPLSHFCGWEDADRMHWIRKERKDAFASVRRKGWIVCWWRPKGVCGLWKGWKDDLQGKIWNVWRKGKRPGVFCQKWNSGFLLQKVFWRKKKGVAKNHLFFAGGQLPHGNLKHLLRGKGELWDQDVSKGVHNTSFIVLYKNIHTLDPSNI